MSRIYSLLLLYVWGNEHESQICPHPPTQWQFWCVEIKWYSRKIHGNGKNQWGIIAQAVEAAAFGPHNRGGRLFYGSNICLIFDTIFNNIHTLQQYFWIQEYPYS